MNLDLEELPSSVVKATPSPAGDFNAILMSMVAQFANCPTAELEGVLEAALWRICEFLDIERAGLWCRHREEADSFDLVQLHPPVFAPSGEQSDSIAARDRHWAVPPHPRRALESVDAGAKPGFPWISKQLQCGLTSVFSSLSELPAAAERDKQALARLGIRTAAVIPFREDGIVIGAMNFELSQKVKAWTQELVACLRLATPVLANAIVGQKRNQKLREACQEVRELKDRLQAETDYLKAEIKLTESHGEIIGRSRAIKRVLQQVEQVAPVDCTVLITGETGTGKELIARAIHRLSLRKQRVMAMVNCAALPATLVESELFGRERGAYTGAMTSEAGRFEAADGSTIFLDEIGELSLEIQAKLLRVLQDGEFQRLGNPRMRKVNVRIIAATNKDLAREVRDGRFREDLYYRLRVFPIAVPALRERMEDLPLLISAFVEEFSSRMSKQIKRLPRKMLETLEQHLWPGNIRELRNVIERGVILSSGETLTVPPLTDGCELSVAPTSLVDVEREHILKTLGEASWRVKGPYGAAKRLQLNPSTLYSRMAKLGIHRAGESFLA